jgi:hypothetical protein
MIHHAQVERNPGSEISRAKAQRPPSSEKKYLSLRTWRLGAMYRPIQRDARLPITDRYVKKPE